MSKGKHVSYDGVLPDVVPPTEARLPLVVRSAFGYDSDLVSRETGIFFSDPTRTKQEFKEEADINTIVERFHITGVMPPNHRVAMFGDFEEPMDFHAAQNRIADAHYAFMQIPPKIRERFGNDPQALMSFLEDRGNREEAKKLGFLEPDKAPEVPLPVRVVAEPQPVNPPPVSSS